MTLSKKEKSWVDSAYLKMNGDIKKFDEFLRVKFKGTEDKMKEFLLYFSELISLEIPEEEQDKFKKRVENYHEEKRESEYRDRKSRRNVEKKYKDVVKWLKEIEKFVKQYRKIVENIKTKRKELDEETIKDVEKDDQKALKLKAECIETIMNANSDVLYVKDPNTGDEVTYESLGKCTIDQLIEVMEDNVMELYEYLNKGKVKGGE